MTNPTAVNVFATSEHKSPNKVVIYGCGGAGVNQARKFESLYKQGVIGYANIVPVYIDTSDSNNVKDPEIADRAYRYEKIEGSGGLRSEHVDLISDSVNEILKLHRPGDLNIVISSLSGGSGSVIAPCLVSELLARNLNVVVIGIGSSETEIRVKNSINTIKSYAAIAEDLQVPIVMSVHNNTPKTPRVTVDDSIFKIVLRLAVLFSGENTELDAKDLCNWLAFHRVTRFPAGLYTLAFVTSEEAKDYNNVFEGEMAVSEATLFPEDTDTSTTFGSAYNCYGYVRQINQDNIDLDYPLGFVITDGRISQTLEALNQAKAVFDERMAAVRPRNTGIVSGSDVRTKRGLVV